MIPMTFPIENKERREGESRMGLVMDSAISEPGAFFGYMSLSAAHKAILSGQHSDVPASSDGKERVLYEPDFYIMKAMCIREINKKLQDPEKALSDEVLDIVVSLLSCTVGG
jgi:hypothetical protein